MINLETLEAHVPSTKVKDKIITIYGGKKTGKTTFGAAIPNHLIFGFEKGYNLIPGAMAVDIKDWNTFLLLERQLKTNPNLKNKYSTVVIDTAQKFMIAARQHVLEQFGVQDPSEVGYGKVWTQIKSTILNTLINITKLGYGVVFIEHAIAVESEQEGKYNVMFAAEKKYKEIINELSDFVIYVQKELKDEYKGLENEAELRQNPDNIAVYGYSYLNNDKVHAVEAGSRIKIDRRFKFSYEEVLSQIERAVQGLGTYTEKTIEPTVVQKRPFEELLQETTLLGKELSDQGRMMQDAVQKEVVSAFRIEPSEIGNIKWDGMHPKFYTNIQSLNIALKNLRDDA